MLRITTSFTLLGAALPPTLAILVAPNSPCSTDCGNVLDSTSSSDVVCADGSFSGDTGQVFQSCLQCEMASGYAKGNQSDAQSSLYNFRYAVSSCLFDYPKSENKLQNSPCVTSKACGPFQNAIQLQNLSTEFDAYQYCEKWDTGDAADFAGCTDCLQANDNFYLANFITVLQAGCVQRPVAGVTLAVEGQVFSTGTTSTLPLRPQWQKVDPAWFDQGVLNLGAKVGIAVGGFVFLLIVAGFFIVWNGKRRRRAYLRTLEGRYGGKGWPSPQGPIDTTDTPLSQRPLRGWDDSPMSENTEKNFSRYISPYSSQFTSPVSARDTTNMQWSQALPGKSPSIGVATGGAGGEDVSAQWNLSHRGKGKMVAESYEMHEVESSENDSSKEGGRINGGEAPVLNHPGYGRTSNSPPLRQRLPEEREAPEIRY